MPDLEKVIKGLEMCIKDIECTGCPYEGECFDAIDDKSMMTDALALLKEQGAEVAHWDDDTGHWIEGDRNGIDPHTRTTGEMIDTFRCSWCGFYQYWKTPFCPNCGAKMEGR